MISEIKIDESFPTGHFPNYIFHLFFSLEKIPKREESCYMHKKIISQKFLPRATTKKWEIFSTLYLYLIRCSRYGVGSLAYISQNMIRCCCWEI